MLLRPRSCQKKQLQMNEVKKIVWANQHVIFNTLILTELSMLQNQSLVFSYHIVAREYETLKP